MTCIPTVGVVQSEVFPHVLYMLWHHHILPRLWEAAKLRQTCLVLLFWHL